MFFESARSFCLILLSMPVSLLLASCGMLGIDHVVYDSESSETETATGDTMTSSEDSESATQTGSSATADTDTATADTDSATADSDTATAETDTTTTDVDSTTTDTDTATADVDSTTTDTDTATADVDSTTDTPSTTTDMPDTATDTLDTESDTLDTESDTLDTESDTLDTGSDTADTDSLAPCAPLPAGVELLSDTDIGDFVFRGAVLESLVSVSGQTFSDAWRLETFHYTDFSYETRMTFDARGDILTGDHGVIEYWSRCISSDTGDCYVSLIYREVVGAFTKFVEYYTTTDASWTFHQVPFVSEVDVTDGNHSLGFRLGYPHQTVEIAPIRIVNYGQFMTSPRPDCLPDNTNMYDAVAIIGNPQTTATADIEYLYHVTVNGYPRPDLTVSGLPGWLTFDVASARMYGLPQYTDVGTTSDITVDAVNLNGADSQTWQITVHVDPNLVGHFPLDQNTGDVSGNSNDGILGGSYEWTALADPDYAIAINNTDGTRDYVELPTDGDDLNDLQDGSYTLAAWVKILAVPSSGVEADNEYGAGIVIKKGADETMNTGLWYGNDERFHASHKFDPSSPTQNELQIASAPISPDGSWHHVAMVMNREQNAMSIYLDGAFVTLHLIMGDEIDHDYGSAPWRIGLADPNAVNHGMWGHLEIDDVRLYNRVLTTHEIENLARIYFSL